MGSIADGYQLLMPDGSKNGYDADGRLIYSQNNAGQTICISYTADTMTIIDEATGKSIVCTYNDGHIVLLTDPNGENVSFIYDANDNLISITSKRGTSNTYTYNGDGQMETCQVEGVGTYIYEYENGNVTKITYPDDNCDKFFYDFVGNVVKYINKNGVVTEYEIDAGGRVLGESIIMEDGTKVTTSATYDAYGKPLSVTDAEGNTTVYTYDKYDNLSSETTADGSVTTFAYDEDGNVTSITYPDGTTTQTAVYDTAGNLKQIVDTLSQITTAEYNSASQLIKATQADGGVVTYEYYDNGQLQSQTDAEGNTTSYAYDSAGRICTVTDLNGNRTSFAYDVMGNCISTVDALGNVTEYTYDAAGQITAVTQIRKVRSFFSNAS